MIWWFFCPKFVFTFYNTVLSNHLMFGFLFVQLHGSFCVFGYWATWWIWMELNRRKESHSKPRRVLSDLISGYLFNFLGRICFRLVYLTLGLEVPEAFFIVFFRLFICSNCYLMFSPGIVNECQPVHWFWDLCLLCVHLVLKNLI